MTNEDRSSSPMQSRLLRASAVFGVLAVLTALASYGIDPPPLGDTSPIREGWRYWLAALFDIGGLVTLDDPAVEPGHWLFSVARLFAMATAGTGVAYLLLALRNDMADWVALFGIREHVVVCGLGRVGRRIVEEISSTRSWRAPVVVIERNTNNDAIERCRRLGAVVVPGDARDPDVRRRAHVSTARSIFIVTGDDVTNLGVAEELRREEERRATAVRSRARPAECFAHLGNSAMAEAAEDRLAALRAFDPDMIIARQLLLDPATGICRRREHGNCVPTTPGQVAHYVLIGFGRMGQAIALQMARLAHFSNLKRLRLTVIDEFDTDLSAQRHRREFLERHPGFCPADLDLVKHVRAGGDPDGWSSRTARPAHDGWRMADAHAVEYAVNAEFLSFSGAVDSPDLIARLVARVQLTADSCLAAVVCFDDEHRSFESAERLRRGLTRSLADGSIGRQFPLYCYLPRENALRTLLQRTVLQEGRSDEQDSWFRPLPFGDLSTDQITSDAIRRMAGSLHEAYRAADSATSFDRLAGTLKVSNEDAASHGDVKLDACGYVRADKAIAGPPADIEPHLPLLARMEHNRWMGERLSRGWRHGARNETAGVESFRRPSFVPWEYLGDEAGEKAKDIRLVRGLVAAYDAIGQVIVRPGS